MRRIDSDLNCSALPRYMTFINYRKWDLVGGRGGPAEQLVDSGTLFVHVTLRWMKVNFTMRIDRCENRFSRTAFFFFLFKKIARQITLPPQRGTRHSYLLREGEGIRATFALNYTTRISFLPRNPRSPLFLYIFKRKTQQHENERKIPSSASSFFRDIAYARKTNERTNEKEKGGKNRASRNPCTLSPPCFSDFWKCTLYPLHSNLLSDNPISPILEIPRAFDSTKNLRVSFSYPTSTTFALLSSSFPRYVSRSQDVRAAFYRSARERADICSSAVRGRNVGN